MKDNETKEGAGLKGRTPSTILGCAIGDSCGAPFEFKQMNDRAFETWNGRFDRPGLWGLKPGQWTDDTKMTIYLAASLLERGALDPDHVAKKYVEWVKTGDLRGIGSTCGSAIRAHEAGTPWIRAGRPGSYAAGNGTLMRCSPIGVVYRNHEDLLLMAAYLDATITHNNREARIGSHTGALLTALLIKGADKWTAVETVLHAIAPSKVKENVEKAVALAQEKVHWTQALTTLGTSGYVVHTIGTAVFALLSTDTFAACVETAVRGGGDADTAGAVAGYLAGSLYGLEGIPQDLIDMVESSADLQKIDQALFDLGSRIE